MLFLIYHRIILVHDNVKFQHVYLFGTEESEEGLFNLFLYYCLYVALAEMSCLCNASYLHVGTCGSDVGVETRSAGCYHLGRNLAAAEVGMVGEECVDADVYLVEIFLVGRTLVRCSGGIVPRNVYAL